MQMQQQNALWCTVDNVMYSKFVTELHCYKNKIIIQHVSSPSLVIFNTIKSQLTGSYNANRYCHLLLFLQLSCKCPNVLLVFETLSRFILKLCHCVHFFYFSKNVVIIIIHLDVPQVIVCVSFRDICSSVSLILYSNFPVIKSTVSSSSQPWYPTLSIL